MQISELLAQVQHHHDSAHAEIERLRAENELHSQRWVIAERKLIEMAEHTRMEYMQMAGRGVTEYHLTKYPRCGHVVFDGIRSLTVGEHLVNLIIVEDPGGCTICGLAPADRLL